MTDAVGEVGSLATSRPSNVPATGIVSGNEPEGFSLKNFLGLFSSSSGAGTRTSDPSVARPMIDWADEESTVGAAPFATGGVKMKSSWLSKFLLHTGAQERHAQHDIEVVLPGKK